MLTVLGRKKKRTQQGGSPSNSSSSSCSNHLAFGNRGDGRGQAMLPFSKPPTGLQQLQLQNHSSTTGDFHENHSNKNPHSKRQRHANYQSRAKLPKTIPVIEHLDDCKLPGHWNSSTSGTDTDVTFYYDSSSSSDDQHTCANERTNARKTIPAIELLDSCNQELNGRI